MNKQEVIEYFIKTFGPYCVKGSEVFISKEPVELNDVGNIQAHVSNIIKISNKPYLFFIDPSPKANCAHICSFCFISGDGKYYVCYTEWPPNEKIEMEKIN